ncbi:MAG TPA: LytTR family DNA-binding domain-containing protein [Flavobacteriales bacterium]|nr:LytTR family DNA-binding domain-containing protein [Flavobacteriales bacterium]HMZ49379.1 LytTR family DNA-binding domain-containing protein [Flavobacteriales bacterium]HNA34013.1 LytTR family DNA-binding domain-containing protein [Flavobacteriales bacterium]HNE79103.1 LytTR family DNA-binding domain-containing protein [Flavobacteriales bacterium]HNI05691.1 LytTR family DNA-binding domain-containing protein [Flavobacteriales bacterium]
MKHIRTIITDDEPAAREHLVRLLAQDQELEVVAECRNGQEAVDAVRKHRPDLLLLDIQMPQMNGLETVRAIPKDQLPFVVFVTAFDHYAIKAFELCAVDYLLKPYDDERFFAALDKAKRHIALRENDRLSGRFMDIMREHLHARSEHVESFTIRDKGREHRVQVADLVYLRAEGNYLWLQLKERHFLHRLTMNAVESELDPGRFLRIHRSYIVNLAHVRSSRYSGNNEFIFTMANGERIVSGRSYKETIARALQEQTV